MVEPDLIDETLDFGDLWFPLGKAFEWAGAIKDTTEAAQIRVADPSSDPAQVLVAKKWLHIGGSDLLIEAVDWSDIQPKLEALPQMANARPADLKTQVAQGRPFPKLPMVSKADQMIKVASVPYHAKGYVFDYIVINPSGSQTFSNGVTYCITNSGYLSGTATFQPGCTIKFATNAYLLMYGSIVCNGTTASLSVFTSVDDDLLGETISISTGTPSYAASQAMWVYYVDFNTEIKGVRIRWAQKGIQYDVNPGVYITHTLRDSVFEQSATGVYVNLADATLSVSSASKCAVPTSISCPGYPYYSCGNISGGLSDDCTGDSDGNGFLDSWENRYFGNKGQTGTADPDGDGLTNSQEYSSQVNGNPKSPDTDNATTTACRTIMNIL